MAACLQVTARSNVRESASAPTGGRVPDLASDDLRLGQNLDQLTESRLEGNLERRRPPDPHG